MLEQILQHKERVPKHIAIIMDGNGRWATQQGQLRTEGHREGVNSVREATKACVEMGVKHLTLYTFSTENWNRPKEEVEFLMNLLIFAIKSEIEDLKKNGIKIRVIGDMSRIPEKSIEALNEAMELTSDNKTLEIILALNYSGKLEIIQAVKKIAQEVKDGKLLLDQINEESFHHYLYTTDIPDPELLIRTSGEYRLSNFLLWQLAYSEFYFTEKLWPDFERSDMYEAVLSYIGRERRFGKTSQQIQET